MPKSRKIHDLEGCGSPEMQRSSAARLVFNTVVERI